MNSSINRYAGAGLVFGASLLSLTGCVCPPCAAAPGVAAAVTVGSKQVIWDGEGTNSGAKGWADCDQKPGCKTALTSEPAVGKDGSTGLKFHAEGSGFLGFGWNWFGWWPPTSGIDISQYNTLSFSIRVEGASPTELPELGALSASLRCSKGPADSASVKLEAHAKDLLNGQWQHVELPLSEFYAGDGAKFDPGSAWEFGMATWSGTPKKFSIFIDDIAVEKK